MTGLHSAKGSGLAYRKALWPVNSQEKALITGLHTTAGGCMYWVICDAREVYRPWSTTNSPQIKADILTDNLPYRGAIPFWFYLVYLRLVNIFLNVGRVEISCGLLPTRFLSMLLGYKTALLSTMVKFQVQFKNKLLTSWESSQKNYI
mgnify:CR=1 FL=1